MAAMTMASIVNLGVDTPGNAVPTIDVLGVDHPDSETRSGASARTMGQHLRRMLAAIWRCWTEAAVMSDPVEYAYFLEAEQAARRDGGL